MTNEMFIQELKAIAESKGFIFAYKEEDGSDWHYEKGTKRYVFSVRYHGQKFLMASVRLNPHQKYEIIYWSDDSKISYLRTQEEVIEDIKKNYSA